MLFRSRPRLRPRAGRPWTVRASAPGRAGIRGEGRRSRPAPVQCEVRDHAAEQADHDAGSGVEAAAGDEQPREHEGAKRTAAEYPCRPIAHRVYNVSTLRKRRCRTYRLTGPRGKDTNPRVPRNGVTSSDERRVGKK